VTPAVEKPKIMKMDTAPKTFARFICSHLLINLL
jgi:hypothetical protein